MIEPTLPPRPLERFLELLDALMAEKRWFQDVMSLRFAASSLLTTPGDATSVARDLRRLAEDLENRAGWFSPLKSSVRFVVAAMMLRTGMNADSFLREVGRLELLFKEHKLWKGTTYSQLSALLLIEQAATRGGHAGGEDVRRLRAVYDEMKQHHRFLTGQDDYPAAALLTGLSGSPGEIGRRCEVFYDGLRDLGFSRGNALQSVSHILVFAPDDDRTLMQRFRTLYDAFDDAGLWMHTGDYDEVATLCFLPQPARDVVAKVLEHRDVLATRPPKPGKELSFSLACGTGFVELAGATGTGGALRDAQNVLAVHAILVAQQTAMMAAAISASTAASSSS
jgi:hypothetical protein